MKVTLSQAKEIVGTTSLSDEELTAKTNSYFHFVSEMTEGEKKHFIRSVKVLESEDTCKYDSRMYGDDRTAAERKSEDQGEQGEP